MYEDVCVRESSGDVRVCHSRQLLGKRSEVVDRKLVAAELSRHGVSVAGVQETIVRPR